MRSVGGYARILIVAAIALCATAPAVRAADEGQAFGKVVEPFLQKYCHACHGPDKQKARIRYDHITGYRTQDQHLWTAVHEMLTEGEMPPEDAQAKPTNAERQAILRWIETEARAAKMELGAGGTRRLNRREFSAALRDVTGLDVDYAASMPGDGKVDGFDTGAEALQDAADSVALQMRIARRAVDGIRFLEPADSKVIASKLVDVKDARRELEEWRKRDETVYVKARDRGKQGVGLLMHPKWVGEKGATLEFAVPPPADGGGVVRIRAVVSTYKPMDGLPNPHLWVEVGEQDLDYREIDAPYDKPLELVYEVQMDDLPVGKRGLSIEFCNRVEMPYAVKGFENDHKLKPDEKIPGGPNLFRPAFDHKKTPDDERPVPFIVLHEIEIDTDYVAAWPPKRWGVDVGDMSDSPETAKRLLNVWMDRAYRRPVGDDEMQRFIELYGKLRQRGMGFDDALRATFQSVLMSAGFRYLKSPADTDPMIAHHAIASRLSFMLWGAPPDDELRRLAAEQKLRDPKVLGEQVDRLLDDARSDAFIEPFVMQWLVLDQPITQVMDHIKQQDFRFGRYLKQSMRQETIRYVETMLGENRPASELLDSDWTMMNNSLAWYYGYDGVTGGELRKTPLRKDDPRGGGILAHAGIQSMLCWMGENWVIYRGAWALRHIFDDPPPPPPLEVPELIPSENKGKTFKELLVMHQEEPNCAVCHKTIDPMGFAFQNFDISGRWRDVEHEHYHRAELDGKIEWYGKGDTRAVDTIGKMPRGEEFKTFDEFKRIAVKNYTPDLVRGMMKNLMIYATGRKPDVDDTAEIKAAMGDLAPQGYPMRDMLKAVVRTDAFLNH